MNYTDLATNYGPVIVSTAMGAANTIRDYLIPNEKKNTNRTK